jgi:transposase
MQSRKRRQYTEEFKCEAARLMTAHGYGVTETARNLGIHAHMLGRWKCQVEQQPNGVYRGNGRMSAEPEELPRLRKEVKRLRMERESLKKRWLNIVSVFP